MSARTILVSLSIALLQVVVLVPATANEVVLAPGQSADLGRVFWADGCNSMLITIVGVDLLEGPPGVDLSIRREDVAPRQANCGKVPGGTVVATIKEVAAPITATLKYRVRYKTISGARESQHTVEVALRP